MSKDYREAARPPRLRWADRSDIGNYYISFGSDGLPSVTGKLGAHLGFDAPRGIYARPAVIAEPLDLDALVEEIVQSVFAGEKVVIFNAIRAVLEKRL